MASLGDSFKEQLNADYDGEGQAELLAYMEEKTGKIMEFYPEVEHISIYTTNRTLPVSYTHLIDELSQVYTFLIACAVCPKGRKSARKTSYFHALGIVI